MFFRKIFVCVISIMAHIGFILACINAAQVPDEAPSLLTSVTLRAANAAYGHTSVVQNSHVIATQRAAVLTKAPEAVAAYALVNDKILDKEKQSDAERVYIPANLISEQPTIALDIPEQFLDSLPGQGRLAVISLFINQHGLVDDAVIEESQLPENIQEQIANAFLKATFNPGKQDGRPVRTKLQVEVNQELPPLDAEIKKGTE